MYNYNETEMSIQELANEINSLDYCIPELLIELCKRAGILDEWNESSIETFESVVYKAADILGVEI